MPRTAADLPKGAGGITNFNVEMSSHWSQVWLERLLSSAGLKFSQSKVFCFLPGGVTAVLPVGGSVNETVQAHREAPSILLTQSSFLNA